MGLQESGTVLDRTFTIPPRFHPAYSLLGRWIRSRSPDRRAAESTYIVAAATLAAVLVVSQVLTWAYLQPLPEPGGFAAFQTVVAVLYAGLALTGRQPAQHLQVIGGELRLERPGAALTVPHSSIRSVSIISASTYYRQHARYRGVRSFVNRIPPSLLLLDVEDGPVVVGLEPADLLEVDRILAEGVPALRSSTRVGAA